MAEMFKIKMALSLEWFLVTGFFENVTTLEGCKGFSENCKQVFKSMDGSKMFVGVEKTDLETNLVMSAETAVWFFSEYGKVYLPTWQDMADEINEIEQEASDYRQYLADADDYDLQTDEMVREEAAELGEIYAAAYNFLHNNANN